MAGLRGHLRRLEREASKHRALIHQRDGSVRAFDRMTVMKEMYLLKYDAALGSARRESAFVEALDNATAESLRAIEQMSADGFYDDLEPADGPPEDLSEP